MTEVKPQHQPDGKIIYPLPGEKVVINPDSILNHGIDKDINKQLYQSDENGKLLLGADKKPIFKPGITQRDAILIIHDCVHTHTKEYNEFVSQKFIEGSNGLDLVKYRHMRDGDDSRDGLFGMRGDYVTEVENIMPGQYLCSDFSPTEAYFYTKNGIQAEVHTGIKPGLGQLTGHVFVTVNSNQFYIESTHPKGENPIFAINNPQAFIDGQVTRLIDPEGRIDFLKGSNNSGERVQDIQNSFDIAERSPFKLRTVDYPWLEQFMGEPVMKPVIRDTYSRPNTPSIPLPLPPGYTPSIQTVPLPLPPDYKGAQIHQLPKIDGTNDILNQIEESGVKIISADQLAAAPSAKIPHNIDANAKKQPPSLA